LIAAGALAASPDAFAAGVDALAPGANAVVTGADFVTGATAVVTAGVDVSFATTTGLDPRPDAAVDLADGVAFATAGGVVFDAAGPSDGGACANISVSSPSLARSCATSVA